MKSLDKKTHDQIKKLSSLGDTSTLNEEYSKALKFYWQAWALLPEPKIDWIAATWILTAIGDVNYLTEDYLTGVENFSEVFKCPNAIGNPFLHMRLGQCLFEIEQTEKALEELFKAYMCGGYEIFSDENPKYLTYLKSKIKLK